MTVIRIVDPVGTMPAMQPRQLADNQAQNAINLKIGNHEARPLDGQTTEATPFYGADTLAIHRYPDVGGVLGTLTQTAAPVGSNIRHSAISPDGKWLAVALTSIPFIAVYAVAGAAITAPTSPTGGDIPAGQGNAVAWSPDGDYIYLGHDITPFLSAWPWTGVWGTKINPASNPGANINDIAVSPNGGYIAAVTGTTPFLSIYPWTGAFGTRVQPASPDIQAGAGNGVVFSRDTRWVLVTHASTPFLSAWRWDGTFGGIRNPDTISQFAGRSIAVSPDGLFIATTQDFTEFLRAWRFDTNREQQPFRYLVADPAAQPGSTPDAIAWDPRGGFIFCGVTAQPKVLRYDWNRGGWGRRLFPDTNPGGELNGISFSPDNKFLYGSFASTTGALAIDRTSKQWFDWNRRVKCITGPVANDFRNRRYFTGDGPPKKTGNDIAIPGTGSPPRLPADWFHLGVKAPGLLQIETDGRQAPPTTKRASGIVDGIAWSPNGKYLAVAVNGATRIEVWDYTDPEAAIKFPDPAILPTGAGQEIAWHPDGDFVGIAHSTSPFVSVYPFSEDGFGAKVADPPTLPAGFASGINWSPDGTFIGVAHNVSPFVSVYGWSGVFGAKAANPSPLPVFDGRDIRWSPDGKFVAVAHVTTPFVSIYAWDGLFGAKVANPAALPAGNARAIAWHPNGNFVAVAHSVSPFITAYPWTGVFGVKVTDPIKLPSEQCHAISWSPDGQFIGVSAHSSLLSKARPIFVYPWFSETTEKTVETRQKVPDYQRIVDLLGRFGSGVDIEDLPPSGFHMDPRTGELVGSKKVTVNTGFSELLPSPEVFIVDELYSRALDWRPDGAYLAIGILNDDIFVYPWLADLTERHYVMTHVTGWGEESGPSQPIRMDELNFNVPLLTFPSEDLTRYNITHRRIYRIVAGETGAEFLFVAEKQISDTTFTDVKRADDLGATLATVGWSEPPSNLAGLASVQGGFMAGISGKLVCFSEPFAPYAWPLRYRRSLSDTPLALGAVGASVIVATEGRPVVYDGLHPANMASLPLDAEQSISNAESLVEVPGGVIYASPDGLFYVTPGSWLNLTGEQEGKPTLFSKDDWTALRPGTMVGVIFDGRYYGFYDSDGAGTFKAIVINGKALSRGVLTIQAASGSLSEVAFADLLTDTLYLVIGGVIKKWDDDAGSPLTSTWKSKKYPLNRPENMAVLRVRATYPGTVTVKVFGDGILRHTAALTSATPVTLNGGYEAEEYEFELSSTVAWNELVTTTSMDEMRRIP